MILRGFAVVGLAIVALAAQAATGSLRGAVTDHGGGLIPGVEITATGTTGETRRVVSNNRGEFGWRWCSLRRCLSSRHPSPRRCVTSTIGSRVSERCGTTCERRHREGSRVPGHAPTQSLPAGATFRDEKEIAHTHLNAAGTLESIHFSKVLLAPDGQAAVIAYWYSCGNLCGNATLALLRKRPDGRWPIAVQKTLLIS